MSVSVRLQLKRGTGADWTAANPVLLDGEAGFDKTANRLKIGDGVHNWNELPYIDAAIIGDLDSRLTVLTGNYWGESYTLSNYDSNGNPALITFSDGVTVTLTYNADGNPTQAVYKSGSTLLKTCTFAYNSDKQLTSYTVV